MDLLFSLAFVVVAPVWLLLLVGPRWTVGRRVVTEPWLYVPLTVVYLVLAVSALGSFVETFADPRLDAVQAFVATDVGVTIGWVHWLVFDVFVGRWMYLDAADRRVPHLAVVPCLLLTLFAGPVGLLAYVGVRTGAASMGGSRRPAPVSQRSP